MKSNETFKNRLIGLQGNLLNFAYQLTANREQAEDLLQDTTLKALDNAISLYLYPATNMLNGMRYSSEKLLSADAISLTAYEPSGVSSPESCDMLR